MVKKIVKKQKQKQKQKQTVIVNINQPTRKTTSKNAPQKQYLPLMPSFNVNQPTPSTDLAKVLGMLIPKLQTESRIAQAIPTPQTIKTLPEPINIGGLIDVKASPSLGDAIAEKNLMAEEEKISRENIRQGPALKPKYEGMGSQIITIKKPVKKTVEKSESVISDVSYLSDISEPEQPMISLPSTPSLPENPIKRPYTKSGKYSKKQQKPPSLTPIFIGEKEESFYPTKPSSELMAMFGEPESFY